jgi:hypothetical protein
LRAAGDLGLVETGTEFYTEVTESTEVTEKRRRERKKTREHSVPCPYGAG